MKNETCPPLAVGSTAPVRPTHWMDDRKRIASDGWLQSDEATSDYQALYCVPCRKTRRGVWPLYPCATCAGTGEDFNEGDPCHYCGGSGGLKKPAGA